MFQTKLKQHQSINILRSSELKSVKKNQRDLINPFRTFVVRITAIHFYGIPYASGYKN